MLKARQRNYLGNGSKEIECDYIEIYDHLGNIWAIEFEHKDGDYIEVRAKGKNDDLTIHPVVANTIYIT